MTTGIKWKRTGKLEPGRIGCGRGTIVKIRLWLVVRGFTLVQPFCFHCYDRYESRQCNIVVDSVLNNNVEKFQRQKSIFGLSYLWCAFHLSGRTGQPDHPFVMQISLFTKLSGQISQFLSKMFDFDGFWSENSFKKKPILFSKWFMNPAGHLRLFQNSLKPRANGRNIVGQQCCVRLHGALSNSLRSLSAR